MIKRLNIPNFGSFSGFDWKNSVTKKRDVREFKRLNILFGRNYSGKTTLSRIFRSLEVGRFPPYYPVTEFEVFADSEPLTQDDISSHSLDIRVYNTDFVKENLSFLTNENEGRISPFAIIGSENKEIEERIRRINEELGDSEQETGVKYRLVRMQKEYSERKRKADEAEDNLKEKLRQHANQVIKKDRVYGDANYNITAIRTDIKTIRRESVTALEPSEVDEKNKLLQEKPLSNINTKVSFTPKSKALYEGVVEILSARIKPSEPIQYLLDDLLLQTWVRRGMDYHRNKEFCGFCGQDLPRDIWEKLEAHFSEESSDLEEKIKKQIEVLEREIESLSSVDLPNEDRFYESVRPKFRDAAEKFHKTLKSYRSENQELLTSLEARQDDIFTSKPQPKYNDLSEEISNQIRDLNDIVKLNNRQTETLSEDQETARKELRLNNVLNFINEIGLSYKEEEISNLKGRVEESEEILAALDSHVRELKEEREGLQIKLRDERRGADKVNEYLNHSFGLDSLSLRAEEDEVESKCVFRIMRGKKPAYNMSEGECSLVSFCYFMAKLEDTETRKEESIIYVDDPVSSLDSNHIFFVFSLIESVLARPEKNPNGSNRHRYKQLFISTHNLDFLKYLKQLSSPGKNNGGMEFFLVEKEEISSSLRLMPKYLKDYQTEFIYLFHQIYRCREAEASEENHQMFYSFGNNLRKFLEAYLFYKYPYREGSGDASKKLHRFFGEDGTTTALTDRIRHELSHLEGIMERGMRPIDIPELPRVASFVVDTIKEKDEEQYNSLLRSIGESP
ncbi:MAG: AAA family ATPase [Bacteroidota bacterium]|nr:AAA family ATPase [Bacteroidota bacterium]MDE2644657.1 AAA family ATPase [Bacteroidota bacterium]MXW14395.1 AAA family ATPase [Rhodothermaceae bacterium]MYC04699.1 AAA family ATPase [Rhodothermaceae bacterium]MYI16613.1 AAA family ATPase [Rhodothermaceae bacterium]